MKRFARLTACSIAVLALQSAAIAATIPDRMNLELVGHSTLNGAGKRDWLLSNTAPGRFSFLPMNRGRCVSVSSTLPFRPIR